MSEGTKQWVVGMVAISSSMLLCSIMGHEEVYEVATLVALTPLVGQWFCSRNKKAKS